MSQSSFCLFKPRKVVATITTQTCRTWNLGTPRKDPEQMADPVTPEATESFGNKGYNVKVGLLGPWAMLVRPPKYKLV